MSLVDDSCSWNMKRRSERSSTFSTKAYVLIETNVGKTKDVLTALRSLNGIRESDAVTGEFDIVAVVESDSLNNIGELVTGGIHTIGGIQRTTTYLSIME